MIDWDRTFSEFGINKDTVKVRDKIYVLCDICSMTKLINYRTYKKVNKPYKCHVCAGRINIKEAQKHRPSTDKLSLASKELWQNQEYRKKVSSSISKSLIAISDKISVNSKISAKKLWNNNEYRKRITEASRLCDMSAIISKAFESPIIRKKLSDNSKKLWQSQEYRDKITSSSIKSFRESPHCSSIQIILYSILDDLGVKYYREYRDKCPDKECCIGPYTVDCVIPRDNNKSLIIECNGDWVHSIGDRVINDNKKISYVTNNLGNIYDIKTIWEHEFKCKDRVIDLIKYWLGIAELEVKNYNFSEVTITDNCDNDECKLLLSKYHYLNNVGRGGITFGAYLNNILIAVCVFSPLIRQNIIINNFNNQQIRELSRFCIHPSYQKYNFGSWFISKCIKRLSNKYKAIISYCDTTYNHDGALYKSLGFKLDAEVQPDYWYVDGSGWVMHKKTLYNHAVKNHKDENSFALENGYSRVYGMKKLRFIKYI
jgi:hypothetical protein